MYIYIYIYILWFLTENSNNWPLQQLATIGLCFMGPSNTECNGQLLLFLLKAQSIYKLLCLWQ